MAKHKSGKNSPGNLKKSERSSSPHVTHGGMKKFHFTPDKKKALIPLFIVLACFGFIWLTPETEVIQPWSEAVLLVDSADKVTDPVQKELLMDKGGKELKELISKYPFHARIHYFYGHYFLKRKLWDSSIFYLKNAIRMDSGGESNTVWNFAKEEIVVPYFKKYEILLDQNKNELALEQLLEAHRYNRTRTDLNLLLADIYKIKKNYDSSLIYYSWYLYSKPNDINVLNDVGIIRLIKKDSTEARKIFEHILKIDPNYVNAKRNLSLISNKPRDVK